MDIIKIGTIIQSINGVKVGLRILAYDIVDEMAADEACSACYEDIPEWKGSHIII
jgi:hypothetical protein